MKKLQDHTTALNVDAHFKQPPGSFAEFVKKEEALLEGLENDRKDRIREARRAPRARRWAMLKPVPHFTLGNWRIGLHFTTIQTPGALCYAVGVYVPLFTCVFLLKRFDAVGLTPTPRP